jgi:hypothetical protein
MLDTTTPAAPAAVDHAVPSAFDSPAWILVGLTRNIPGWLAYQDGGLAFADTDGDVLFAAELSDVRDLEFPWYYFGGGLKLKVLGKKYRLSFVRPNGAVNPAPEPQGLLARTFLGRIAHDITTGRAATAEWRAILARKG